MSSPWAAVDQLMRELGSLRTDARALEPAASASLAAEVDWLIASAAQAVDDTIGAPESEPLLLGACAAIVEARERIGTLKAAVSRSERVVARSVELRRKSARLLYDSIRGGAGEKFER
jgi:hypothetical protein